MKNNKETTQINNAVNHSSEDESDTRDIHLRDIVKEMRNDIKDIAHKTEKNVNDISYIKGFISNLTTNKQQ